MTVMTSEKKALLAAVALLLSSGARLPAAPAAAPAEHANYMPNPGFEVVKDGWAEGWLKFHDPTSSTLELDERVKKSGKCAANISFIPNAPEKASRYSGMIHQFGGMFRPGSTYTYSAYVKTKGLGGTVWLEATNGRIRPATWWAARGTTHGATCSGSATVTCTSARDGRPCSCPTTARTRRP